MIRDHHDYIAAVSLHIRGEGENNQEGGSDQEIMDIRQGCHVWRVCEKAKLMPISGLK